MIMSKRRPPYLIRSPLPLVRILLHNRDASEVCIGEETRGKEGDKIFSDNYASNQLLTPLGRTRGEIERDCSTTALINASLSSCSWLIKYQ